MAVAAGVFIASTFISVNEQRKREKRVAQANREAREVETAVRANEARRSRREQIREARVRRAQIENVAATAGQETSSAAIASADSITNQLGVNLGTINEILAEGGAKSVAEQNIFDANRRSGLEVLAGATANVSSRFIGA